MLLASFLHWWYGDGWRRRVQMISTQIDGITDFFSFSLLLKTLFSPYRQISAGKVDGPLEVKFRAMLDKLFSRAIGAVVRLIIMAVGLVIICLLVVYSVIFLVGWALVPVLPVVGFIVMAIGWTP